MVKHFAQKPAGTLFHVSTEPLSHEVVVKHPPRWLTCQADLYYSRHYPRKESPAAEHRST